jgi:hypothetical protein
MLLAMADDRERRCGAAEAGRRGEHMVIGQAAFPVSFALEIVLILMALASIAVMTNDAQNAYAFRPRTTLALLAEAIRFIFDLVFDAYRRTTRTTVWGVMMLLGTLLGRDLLRHS